MNVGTKIIFIGIGLVALVMTAGYVAIYNASGLDSPLSVVMSSSMQHEYDRSAIGVIDTGDVVVVQEPSRTEIQSYVEGTVSGFKTFGDYGSVIIYNRDNSNPVIHRAIIWLEYNGNRTWSAPSLQNYEGKWETTGSSDIRALSGTLTFHDLTVAKKTVSISLDPKVIGRQSGYLTLGDNPVTNTQFDQAGSIIDHLIGTQDIKSVPIMELPWLGVVKVYLDENKRSFLTFVPNSIVSIVMLFGMIFTLIYCCDVFYRRKQVKEKELKYEQLNRFY